MNQSEGTSAIERLAACRNGLLPDELSLELIEMGEAAVPALLAVLEEPEGRPAAQAAMILGEIGDPRAIGPLLTALRVYERGTVAHDQLIFALERFGQAAVEPALAAHDESEDGGFRGDVLCGCRAPALAMSGSLRA